MPPHEPTPERRQRILTAPVVGNGQMEVDVAMDLLLLLLLLLLLGWWVLVLRLGLLLLLLLLLLLPVLRGRRGFLRKEGRLHLHGDALHPALEARSPQALLEPKGPLLVDLEGGRVILLEVVR